MTPKEKAIYYYETLTNIKDKDKCYVIIIEENWRTIAIFIINEFLKENLFDKSYVYTLEDGSLYYTTYLQYYTEVLLEINKL